jgi:hypothetical protein
MIDSIDNANNLVFRLVFDENTSMEAKSESSTVYSNICLNYSGRLNWCKS